MSSDVAEPQYPLSGVPDGWAMRQLGQVARIVTGKTPSTKDDRFWNGDVPFVTPSDIGDSPWCDTVDRHLSPLGAATVATAPAGAVLFTCIASIGKSCILSATSAFNQQINACIPGPSVDSYFLFSQLQAMCEEISHLAGTTAVPIINKTTFSAIPIYLPSLDEQRRIAEVLRSVDEAIAAADEVARQWARTFETLLDAAFAEGEPANLGDICSLIYRYPGFYGFDQLETGVPVIRGEHLRAGRISRDWADYYFVDPAFSARFPKTILELDDVVMSVRGTVGTTAVVDAAHVGSQISPNLIRLVADSAKIVPPLLYYAVQSAVAHMRRTIVNAQALPAINAGDLKQVEIALPSLADQPALLAELNGVSAARADAVSAAQQARHTKAVVMSDLLSGRVRVPA